jgi:uncharacterized protein with ParB-like and HNH nuclease domain
MRGINDTSSKTYRQLMGNGMRYEIPKFQRDYSWEAEQWDDLWMDLMAIIDQEEMEHYMGYTKPNYNTTQSLLYRKEKT